MNFNPSVLNLCLQEKGEHHSLAFEGNKSHKSHIISIQVVWEWMQYKCLERTDENIWNVFDSKQ